MLDDGNLEDGSIQFCVEDGKTGQCGCGHSVCLYGVQLAELLLRMTRTQRERVYRLTHEKEPPLVQAESIRPVSSIRFSFPIEEIEESDTPDGLFTKVIAGMPSKRYWRIVGKPL